MPSVAVPDEFRPEREVPYPPHQRGPLIEGRFFEFHEAHAERFPDDLVYLPVFWTAYYQRHDFSRRALRRLQEFLDFALEPDVRYFTIVQSSDELHNLLPESVIRFGAGGVGDVPIPLLCDPRPILDVSRDVFASFMGSDTHWCRRRLVELAARESDWVVRRPVDGLEGSEAFGALMLRSEFALCPRGHGPTSFRLYEALQLGAIPVYLFDRLWLPYTEELNWRSFAVLVHLDELAHLPRILAGIPDNQRKQMRERIRGLVPDYFSFAGCCERILERLLAISRHGFAQPWYGRSPNERSFLDRFARTARARLREEA